MTPPGGNVVEINPDPAVAGQSVSITYDPVGGPLAGASQVYHALRIQQLADRAAPDALMTWNAAENVWSLSVPVSATASQFDVVFNNGAGVWHNNSGQDWHFNVTGTQAPAFVMDGVRDAASPASRRQRRVGICMPPLNGDVLYVATEDAGEGNDVFIYLADAPGALRQRQLGQGRPDRRVGRLPRRRKQQRLRRLVRCGAAPIRPPPARTAACSKASSIWPGVRLAARRRFIWRSASIQRTTAARLSRRSKCPPSVNRQRQHRSRRVFPAATRRHAGRLQPRRQRRQRRLRPLARTHSARPTDLRADGNGDGKVDAADYVVWRKNFGASASGTYLFSRVDSPVQAAVPEPSALAFAAIACPVSLTSATHSAAFMANRPLSVVGLAVTI